MGSATRQALAESRSALAALAGSGDGASGPGSSGLEVGAQLFTAGEVIGTSGQLRQLLADPSSGRSEKKAIIQRVFGSHLSTAVQTLLVTVATNRWSDTDDVLAGIEELGLRAIADSASSGTDIENELFAFGTAVRTDAELELAVGSKLGDTEAKVALVEHLLAGEASPQTLAIVRHLVRQPRGRRIGQLLSSAASVIADQAGLSVATITTASPLAAAQLQLLQERLSTNYGRALRVNQVIDGRVLGGVRVQIGDDIIDGSVSSKLKDLKLQLVA